MRGHLLPVELPRPGDDVIRQAQIGVLDPILGLPMRHDRKRQQHLEGVGDLRDLKTCASRGGRTHACLLSLVAGGSGSFALLGKGSKCWTMGSSGSSWYRKAGDTPR